jgi:hypothetical protein
MNALVDSSAKANGLRETPVVTEPPRQPQKKLNPTRLFVDKDRTAFFWFLVAVVACVVALIQPYFLITKLKERERVVIVDPAGTYYVSPVLQFQEAKELHAQQATLAAVAFLDRNPKGFDHPELLKQIFLKAAHEKALNRASSESAEFDAKQLHQKAEIAEIKLLETRENFVLTQVTGQLVRTGVFDEKAFSEGIPFTLAFKMVRNPDMTKNGRFPTAVSDFKYEPAR